MTAAAPKLELALELALAQARDIAGAVPDPELPMLTLADLGILREVTVDDAAVTSWSGSRPPTPAAPRCAR